MEYDWVSLWHDVLNKTSEPVSSEYLMSLRIRVFTDNLKIQYMETKQTSKKCLNKSRASHSNWSTIQWQSLFLNLHSFPLYTLWKHRRYRDWWACPKHWELDSSGASQGLLVRTRCKKEQKAAGEWNMQR